MTATEHLGLASRQLMHAFQLVAHARMQLNNHGGLTDQIRVNGNLIESIDASLLRLRFETAKVEDVEPPPRDRPVYGIEATAGALMEALRAPVNGSSDAVGILKSVLSALEGRADVEAALLKALEERARGT